MYSIIITILSCLIIILLFNKLFKNNFESFNLVNELKTEQNNFDNLLVGAGPGGGGGSLSGTDVIAAPNTGGTADTIDTISRIIIQRMCKSTDCTDRETRWGSPNKGNWSVKPETFKKIINKFN
jgi:hypothetical protein